MVQNLWATTPAIPLDRPSGSARRRKPNAMEIKDSHRNDAGFSLIELFVVLLVVGVLITLAVIGFGASVSNLDRQNIAREFKVALERARYDSVKRRPSTCDDMSRVEILSATSFRLLTDTNRNGAIEANEGSTINFTGRSLTEIVGDATLTFPMTIRFDGRGNTSSGPCTAPTDTYASTTFCETPCTLATANPENATVIYVSPTGTTTMLAGGESIASVSAPSVSTVDPTVQINPLLGVWNAVTGGGSPSPTPTPDPTITPDPDPDPTGTPDPDPSPTGTPDPGPSPTSPTPTPTATPLPDCTLNQRPGSPAVCTCRLPWTVGANGKCQP